MKKITVMLLLLASHKSYAQSGPGIEFSYDAAGMRYKREYKLTISYLRKTNGKEEEVDTLNTVVFKNSIKAYPNPVADNLIVENSTWKTGDRVVLKVYDMAGKHLYNASLNEGLGKIPTGNLLPGIYQVHYILNNKQITTWKIIKK